MGIPCVLDPLGSCNGEAFTKGKILGEIANPQQTETFEVDMPKPGTLEGTFVGGGNTTNWCYIGCNYPGSAAGWTGKMYFKQRCHLRVTVGAQDQSTILQVAEWGNKSVWHNLIVCEAGKDASGGAGRGGYCTVNKSSTFNNYFEDKEMPGIHGTNGGWPASVWGGYGTKDINGYGKLQYIGIVKG